MPPDNTSAQAATTAIENAAVPPTPGVPASTPSSTAGAPSSTLNATPTTSTDAPSTSSGAPPAGDPPPALTPEQLALQAAERDNQAIADRIRKRREGRAPDAAATPAAQVAPQQQQPDPNAPPALDPRIQKAFVDLQSENAQWRQAFNELRQNPIAFMEKLGVDRKTLVQRATTSDEGNVHSAEINGLKQYIQKLEEKLDGKISAVTQRYDTDNETFKKYERDAVATQVRNAADPQKHWAFADKYAHDSDAVAQGAADFLTEKRVMAKEAGNPNWERVTCTYDEVVNYLNTEALRELEPQIAKHASRLGWTRTQVDAADAAAGTGSAGGPLARSATSSNGAGVHPPEDISKLPPEVQFERMAESARAARKKAATKKR